MILFDVTIIAIESILLLWLVNKALPLRHNRWLVLFLLATAQIIRRLLMGDAGMITILPSLFIDFFAVYLSFDGKAAKKNFIIVIFYTFNFIFDAAAVLIFVVCELFVGISPDPSRHLIAATILSKSFVFIAIMLTGRAMSDKENKIERTLFHLIPALSILLIVLGFPNSERMVTPFALMMLTIVCIFSLIANYFLIILFRRKEERLQLKKRIQDYEQMRRMYEDHFLELRAAYTQVEHTIHDTMRHYDFIGAADNIETIRKYIKKLRESGFSEVFTYTGNVDMDTIITSKRLEMQSKEIGFSVSGKLPPVLEWVDAVDASIILGNALTNAIEGCEHCTDKNIIVSFTYDLDWLLISIENTTDRQPHKKTKGFGFISNKADPGHGYGLENILSSADQYDGVVKYQANANSFRLDVMLQKCKN